MKALVCVVALLVACLASESFAQPRAQTRPVRPAPAALLTPLVSSKTAPPQGNLAEKHALGSRNEPIVCTPRQIEGYWSFANQLVTVPENPSNSNMEASSGCKRNGVMSAPLTISLRVGGITAQSHSPNPQVCADVVIEADFVESCHRVEGTVVAPANGPQAGPISGDWIAPPGPPVCVRPGDIWISAAKGCVPGIDIDRTTKEPLTCPKPPEFGKPIRPLTGTQREPVHTGLMIGREELVLTYDTTRLAPRTVGSVSASSIDRPAFGAGWSGALHRAASVQATQNLIQVSRGDGRVVTTAIDTEPLDPDTIDAVSHDFNGTPDLYLYFDIARKTVETYVGTRTARLTQLEWIEGQKLRMTYSDANTPSTVAPASGYLISIIDSFGREMRFSYSLPQGGIAEFDAKVSSITDTSGRSVALSYDAKGNLKSITWADGKIRQFVYDDPNYPWALTGMIDEENSRHFTIGYDADGRAISSQLAGGVDSYTINYGSSPPQIASIATEFNPTYGTATRIHEWQVASAPTVTLPDGNATTITSSLVAGFPRTGGQTQVGGSGCSASSSLVNYDSAGNATSVDDFNGNRSCMSYAENKEIARIEGLPNTVACSNFFGGGAALPVGARKISTAWRQWNQKNRVAEPHRLTTYVYNGDPDRFAQGAIASCAPATAQLSYGSPIAVLCKKVEQATLDANGKDGFGPDIDPNVPARVETWTYNEHGQVLTYDGPRTDVSDITYYTYYSDTVFSSALPDAIGHTKGDLARVVSPALLETQFTKYNRAGRVMESIDANGVISSYDYDARQRLSQWTVAGLTTSFEYWPTGLLKRVTLPDGTWLNHQYDGAHRLRVISDDRGNSITYTLDNRGQRTAENVRDPSNQLRRTLTRSIDALGRVQQITGRE